MGKAKAIEPIPVNSDQLTASVFSSERTIEPPKIALPHAIKINQQQKMDGMKLLSYLPDRCVVVAFFDPQYRGILDKMGYGNEGKQRGRARCSLKQMTEKDIHGFIVEIDRVLIDSGHLFLWMDKFHLCTGFSDWLSGTKLDVVDMITWDKGRMGMGYRTRRIGEHLVVLQRLPRKAKGVWKIHNIPDVWREEIPNGNGGVHPKPVHLQGELIEAVSNPGDLVLDPAAGSYSVLKACRIRGRNFIGGDLNG